LQKLMKLDWSRGTWIQVLRPKLQMCA